MSSVLSIARRVACTGVGLAVATAVLRAQAPEVANAAVPAQSLAYVGGIQYATGDFVPGQRTWGVYLSNGLSWSAGRVRATALVPVVMQPAGGLQYFGSGMMGPTGVIGGGAGSPSGSGTGMGGGGTMTPSTGMPFSRVGIGDPIGRLDIALRRAGDTQPQVSVVGVVKAPLADAGRGFGTGQWDFGAGLAGAARVAGAFAFAEIVYWRIGNPPGATLRDAVSFALSIGRAMPDGRWSLLGTVSGATSPWTGFDAPIQAGLGVNYRLEAGSSVFVTVAAGLTRTAPMLSTGLGWRVPLGGTR